MDIQGLLDAAFIMVVMLFILACTGLVILGCIFLFTRIVNHSQAGQAHKKGASASLFSFPAPAQRTAPYSSAPAYSPARSEVFPNGYSRQDYHDQGWDDGSLDLTGMNQPGAPAPAIAAVVMEHAWKEQAWGK